jgi:TolB-like protein
MAPRIQLLGGFALLDAGGAEVQLPTRKAQALLALLARRPGAAIARARLAGLLWPDRPDAQGRASLRQALASIRRALAACGAPGPVAHRDAVALDPAGVEVDVASFEASLGSGDLDRALGCYRGPFLDGFPPVEDLFDEWLHAERNVLAVRATEALRVRPSARRGPSLAVLPFEVLGEDPAAPIFARGLAEDICVDLSRFRTIEVIAPGSAGHAATAGLDPAALGRSLGAEYLLGATVRAAGGRMRVAPRLLEAATGRQVWADRYDADLADVFSVQDRIAQAVASALALGIDEHELARARSHPPERLDAYSCWVKGMTCLRAGTSEGDREARGLFLRALELDPSNARAHAGLSLAHFNDWSCAAWERWDENEREAFRYAAEAARLDDRDHVAHFILGRVLIYRREFERGAQHLERALALNPGDADVLAHAALGYAYLGDPARGLALGLAARRLHPFHPEWHLAVLAMNHFFAREPGEAVALLERAPDAYVDSRAFLAAGYAHLGDLERARENARRFLARFARSIAPGASPADAISWVLRVNPLRREEDRVYLVEGMARAGIPVARDREAGAGAGPAP